MLEEAVETKEMAVQSQTVAVRLANEVLLPLLLQLPPAADLNEIRKLSFSKVSAEETSGQFNEESKSVLRHERDLLLKKFDRYKHSPTFLSHLATLSELSGDLNGAVEYLRGGAEVDPSNFHTRRLGRAFMMLSRPEDAANAFKSTDLASDADSNLGLACLSLLGGKYDEASSFVNAALDIDAASFSALLLAGALELRGNQADLAVRYFRSAIEVGPGSSVPYVLLGTTYLRMGRKDKASDMFRRAVAMNPIDENAVILYADSLLLGNRFVQAVSVLRDFLQFEQKSLIGWDRLGRAFYELGKNAEALSAFKHQASIQEHYSAWNNIGLVFWKMGDIKRASSYLSLALKRTVEEDFPSFLPLYNTFIFLRAQGKLEEALTVSEAIPFGRVRELAKIPIASKVLALRCEVLAELGRYEESEHQLEVLLRTEDVGRDLRLSLLQAGTFLYSVVMPDMDKALKCARVALREIERGEIEEQRAGLLLNNIAFVFIEFDQIDEAERLIPKLSPWIHKLPTATATLGLMHLRKGHLEVGRRLYLEAITLADRRLKSRLKEKMQLEIGKVLLQQGNSRAAVRYLKGAVKSRLAGIGPKAAELLASIESN